MCTVLLHLAVLLVTSVRQSFGNCVYCLVSRLSPSHGTFITCHLNLSYCATLSCHIVESHRYKKFMIFTDSLSSLQSISRHAPDHPITSALNYTRLSLIIIMSFFVGYRVTLVYQENAVQMSCKNTMHLPITHISVPYLDPLIYTHIHSECQL